MNAFSAPIEIRSHIFFHFENLLWKILIIWNFLRFGIWSILINILWTTWRNVQSAVARAAFYSCQNNSVLKSSIAVQNMFAPSISYWEKCIKISKYIWGSISPFSSVSFYFMFFGAMLLDAYEYRMYCKCLWSLTGQCKSSNFVSQHCLTIVVVYLFWSFLHNEMSLLSFIVFLTMMNTLSESSNQVFTLLFHFSLY